MLRFSQDDMIHTNSRKLLDFCKQNGLRICNGRLGLDYGVGECTFVGSTGSSVVDYIIVNPSLFPLIQKFQVCDPNICQIIAQFNVHCLVLQLKIYPIVVKKVDHSE